MTPNDGEFYVPDEPLEELIAAYETGNKGVTARPVRERTSGVPSHLSNISGSFFSTGATSVHAGAPTRFTAMAGTFRVTRRTT